MNDGFAELRTPLDLLRKLEHDRIRMDAAPEDSYAAFDFFVTAEHLVDWLHPDTIHIRQKDAQANLRNSERVLQITSHIANGSKHFRVTARHHTSVVDIENREGGFSPSAFSTKAFSPSAFAFAGLHVTLDDGSIVHAFSLADDVLEFWRQKLSP